MSFFSSFFKCCETSAIQSEARTELHIVRTDKHSPSFAIIDNQKFKDQSPKKRNVSKSPSFINMNTFNTPAASSSPRNNLNNIPSPNVNNLDNKRRVSSNNLFEFDMMNNGNNYNINNVENFTSIKNINFIINQPSPPAKNQIFFFDNVQTKNNLESPSAEEWDVGDSGAEEGEGTHKSGGTSQRRKKDKLKIDLKYATMGDFDWHNLDKESKESSFTEVYRKEGSKRMSSALNEQDVDIALLHKREHKKEKKEVNGKTKGEFKKYQTLDPKKVKSNPNNNDVEEMIKKKLKEMPEHENNNNLSDGEEDGSKTPVFSTPPNKRNPTIASSSNIIVPTAPPKGIQMTRPTMLKKFSLRSPIYSGCPCSTNLMSNCPPCTNSPSNEVIQQIMALNNCDCAPRLQCEPCPKLYQAIHEMAVRQATFELKTQGTLQAKAQEQARLYGEAQKYAMEMQQQEEKALEAAKLMNEAANRAEISRQHMLKANAKARELAESTLYAYGSSAQNNFLSSRPSSLGGFDDSQSMQPWGQGLESEDQMKNGNDDGNQNYSFKENETEEQNFPSEPEQQQQ